RRESRLGCRRSRLGRPRGAPLKSGDASAPRASREQTVGLSLEGQQQRQTSKGAPRGSPALDHVVLRGGINEASPCRHVRGAGGQQLQLQQL
ncbi:unnamed protein product, partial [Lampetra fluviatilis]